MEKQTTMSIIELIGDKYIPHFSNNTWGDDILLMGKDGFSFGRVYWYYDDKTTIYLNWLSVNDSVRRQGIGTELQKIREEIGRILGATLCCLEVEKDSWMHDWYKRRGYEDLNDDEYDQRLIWMIKSL